MRIPVTALDSGTSSSASLTTKATPITEVNEDNIIRFGSGSRELDLVLGGGIVPGSLTLIGGSPGIGKSTLLLKIAGNLAQKGQKILYVSGEESAGQIKLRANRLDANAQTLYLLSEINLSHHRLHPDTLLRREPFSSRFGNTGTHHYLRTDAHCQKYANTCFHYRAHHQRRIHRRPAGTGAYGRYGTLL